MLCKNCEAQLVPQAKLATRLRNLNAELFDGGKVYWETRSAAMGYVKAALYEQGFALPEEWAYTLRDSTATVRAEVGSGKRLTLHLYRMEETGRYELVAYVN
jgi:hypothetical protein